MKHIIKVAFLFIFVVGTSAVFGQIRKSDLSILYIGVNPEKGLSKRDSLYSRYKDRIVELQQKRSADYEQFLKQYFKTVDVIYSENFKEELSDSYDVTIIDDYLPVISGGYTKDKNGEILSYEKRQYLSKEYNAATVMIGEPSAYTGEGRELQINHLCLCLDAHAHSMNLKHPIFNKPYKIDVDYEEVELTGNYHVRYSGRNLGKTMPMWRIQTEGYRDEKGFPVGLVSSGIGFDNEIDAEWISSGTCDKGIEATAIGRHANFFHWGFVAAPEYMTESAKLAFINAIHYIAPYKGAEQITKSIKGIMRRPLLREQQWTLSDEGSSRWVNYVNEGNKKTEELKVKLRKRKEAGEKLSEHGVMLLQMPEKKDTREWTTRHEPQERKDKFGDDWAAYHNFYKENMDYFFPTPGGYYKASVDEDAKDLGIANSDIKILSTAVKMLKKDEKNKVAIGILERYTKESFDSATEWIEWFKTNKKQLYFSEGDGYKYIVLPL